MFPLTWKTFTSPFLLLLGVFSLCPVAIAQVDIEPPPPVQVGIKAVNRKVGLHLGMQHINYYETDPEFTLDGKQIYLDSENGSQKGLKFTATTQFDAGSVKNLYIDANWNFHRGKTRYDGHYQDPAFTPVSLTTHTSSWDLGLKIGKGFGSDRLQVTPYLGYGYRQWERDFGREGDVVEIYSHNAWSLGMLTQMALSQRFVIGVDVSVGMITNAQMELEKVIVTKLRSRPIYSIGLSADYRFNDFWHVTADYRYTQFRYGDSGFRDYGVNGGTVTLKEPSSKTKLSQFYLGVGYGF